MRFFFAAAIVLALGFVPASAGATSPTVIRETLATYVKAHPYAVVAVDVIDRGREATYFVRGSQAKEPLDEHTRFQIGSITKVFTATILAQLVDAGQVTLSDPIQHYLPVGMTAPSYRGQPITVLSLATHTSGLPGDPPNDKSIPSPADYSPKMLADAVNETTLSRAPGSRWEYSNFGFAVLGQMLANTAHLSYDDLVKQRILDPLGMDETVVTGSAATRRELPPAFEYGGAPGHPESLGALGPAGSIESDLKDMALFLKANLDAPNGPLGRDLAFAQQPRTPVPEWNMSMGLAWQTVLAPTHHVPGDLGDLEPGSLEKGGNTDGFSSFIALNRSLNWGVVAMTNVNDDDFQQVIAHAVSPSTARLPVFWATAKREASPLSGRYLIETGRRMALDIFKYKGALYVWIPSATPSKLTPAGENRYTWDEVGVTFTFHRDGNGRVRNVTVVQNGRTMTAKKI